MHDLLKTIFPNKTGFIHFIGIGGIGMSGIAEILFGLGYKISGSDLSPSYITDKLEQMGIRIVFGHKPENIYDISIVVKSTAVKDDNPEIIEAKKLGIPIIKRSEMLAELMRFKHSISISGTHGKTTTTSLVASILDEAGLLPTVINGGVIQSKKTNAYLGTGNFLVAEADESDGTFIRVPSYAGVITNIDPEHLDYYGTFENLIKAFKSFIENLPFYGFGVVCYDHKTAREIGESITNRKLISYGIRSDGVDVKAINIQATAKNSKFDVILSKKFDLQEIKDIELNTLGNHNVLNSLAAIAVALEIGISPAHIKKALASFQGVKRRFTKTGEVDGIQFIDDYAHHPEEIKVTLETAKILAEFNDKKVIAVVQPHRYSRLAGLMEEFADSFSNADFVYVADVYAAGEVPIVGVDSETLVSKILGKKIMAKKLPSVEFLADEINNLAKSGDIVVLLGAGNITKWAHDLPKDFEKLRNKSINS